ncbi:hypothetical protein AZ047_002413 [Klebsiella pneumoniae]|jgi:hypothetical protein|nr:hypothetical protein AZ047_002413 [Klebsiella pneumoniae]VFZ88451.1 Uncharacterised protein [Klebsiella pneumoniae]
MDIYKVSLCGMPYFFAGFGIFWLLIQLCHYGFFNALILNKG